MKDVLALATQCSFRGGFWGVLMAQRTAEVGRPAMLALWFYLTTLVTQRIG